MSAGFFENIQYMKGRRMAAYLVSGIVFGLSSGLAPGPLLTLVLTETLRHGKKGGSALRLRL